MLEEYIALQNQGTWSLVTAPPSKNIIGCKWVFKIKRNADGSIARYKARLVAKGYLQEEGIDYQETFSPVAKQPTVRILFSLALHYNWSIQQLDVSNAFLHGLLNEEVYMTQPPGFENDSSSHLVCKLHKALYGLKQAPRAWYSTFSSSLISLGFVNSHCDPSLFVQKTTSTITYLLVYVDDILLTGNSRSHIQSLISQLNSTFSLKDLGPVSHFLGISVTHNPTGYFLSQSKYATNILAKAGMTDCKPFSSPLSIKPSTDPRAHDPYPNPSLYRTLVGALQYLTITRPDLALAVN